MEKQCAGERETQLRVLLKMYETLGEVICAESTPVTRVSEFRQRIRGSALVSSVCSAFQAKGKLLNYHLRKGKSGEAEAEGGESAKSLKRGEN